MLKEIKIAVNTALKQKFADIEIQSSDIAEGFLRPCFFTELDKIETSEGIYKNNKFIIRIYYFPRSRYKNQSEIIEMQEELNYIFSSFIKADNKVITINEKSITIEDGILIFEIRVEFVTGGIEEIPIEEVTRDTNPNNELMKDLDIEIAKEWKNGKYRFTQYRYNI